MTGINSDSVNENQTSTPTADRGCLLIIDTDPGVRWSLEKGLSRSGYQVLTAEGPSQALRLIHDRHVDTVLMELLPEAGLTLDALSSLVDTSGPHKVICLSIDASPQTVIECIRRGAADYIMKPFGLAEVRRAVARTLEGSAAQIESRQGEATPNDQTDTPLIGVSSAMQELRHIIRRSAQTDLNCLIRGESGVGKDLVAREIHRLSDRNVHPYVKINCSALPEHLLESELFGYEKGAFTGAYKSKPGRFTLADPGIIFLDEIGDMYTSLQAKILQVIEHKEFTKIGGQKPLQVDVQVIAATNADLESKIAKGEFRDDLYFRLNEVTIWVPPLRERREDVPLLVHHFVRNYSEFTSAENAGITGKDLELLAQYDWPGNIRELESTVKRWLALGRRGFISEHIVRSLIPVNGTPSALPLSMRPPLDNQKNNKDSIGSNEVLQALEKNQWNRRKAAQELGISYSALRRRIEKYSLDKRPT